MKKKNLLLIPVVASALLVACQKEVVKPTSTQASSNHSSEIRFFAANGSSISRSEVNMDTEEAVLFVDDADGTIKARYFKTTAEAYAYVAAQPHLKQVKKQMEFAKEVRELAERTGDIHVTDGNYSPEMKELLASYSASNAKGVGLIFDYLNAQGPSSVVTGNPQPTLFGFNNRAESAQGVGLANWLWDKKFFNGSSIYLLMGTGGVLNFNHLNFLNRAESSL